MDKRSFVIRFDIWLVKAKKVLTMQAVAQPDLSEQTYLVHSFSNSKILHDSDKLHKLSLPYLAIQCIERNGKKIWVHAKSGRETIVSSAIGTAIELQQPGVFRSPYRFPELRQRRS